MVKRETDIGNPVTWSLIALASLGAWITAILILLDTVQTLGRVVSFQF